MKGIICVDVDKCVACKACELACAIEHSESKSLNEAILEEPRPRSRIRVEAVGDVSVPVQCRHCEDPMCVRICPTEAMVKLDTHEPVICKEDDCNGCRLCTMTCPYGVLDFDAERKLPVKCDMCIQRQENGELPACVESCPTGALWFRSPGEASSNGFLVAVEASEKGNKEDETEG